jgi:hypothetical protein
MQFKTEVKQKVSRLTAIEGIVILDDQIVTRVLMSLPPSLKLNFGVDSTPEQEKKVRCQSKISDLQASPRKIN